MFDLVHKHKRIAQFILALIMIPFAFFGVDYYFRRSDGVADVAKFDGGRITQAEFVDAIRDQQERLRRQQRTSTRRSSTTRKCGTTCCSSSCASDSSRSVAPTCISR